MKAFRILPQSACDFVEQEMPVLTSPDSVIVKVKAVGICGSDIGAYKNGRPDAVIPGHEVVGVVVQKGENVTKLEVGDHAVLEPLVSCGSCYACKKGYPNVCKDAICLGCQVDGGMSEYFMYDQNHWHKLPKELPWLAAVLIEPYTVGLEVVSRGRVQAGDVVLIHGAGPAGLIALDLSKKLGATVVVSEIVDGRLERARSLGADYTINPLHESYKDRIMEITNGEGPNVIIDAAGLPSMLTEGADILSQAGRYVLMGIGKFVDASYNMLWASGKEFDIVGSRMQQKRFLPVIENAASYLENYEKLVTDVFPFERSEEALILAAKAAPDTAKVVVEFPD